MNRMPPRGWIHRFLRIGLLGGLTAVAAAGCEKSLAPPADDAGTPGDGSDAGPADPRARWEEDADAGCTDQAPGLLSKVLLSESPTALAYKVAYRSGGTRVLGQLCVPKQAGPHPIALYNHAGLDGMNPQWGLGTVASPTLCGRL